MNAPTYLFLHLLQAKAIVLPCLLTLARSTLSVSRWCFRPGQWAVRSARASGLSEYWSRFINTELPGWVDGCRSASGLCTSAYSTLKTNNELRRTTGSWAEPVIRVITQVFPGEGQETARNSPFPWRLAKDVNAATMDIPVCISCLIFSRIIFSLAPNFYSAWILEYS